MHRSCSIVVVGHCVVPMSKFFGEHLKGRVFENLGAAFRHIQIQAMKEGFEIGCNQSFESVYGTFYCLKGGRKRGASSSKTGCGWHIKLTTCHDHGCVKISSMELEHNHECHPDMYSVFTCSEQEQDLIRKMSDVHIPPKKIIQLMNSLGVTGVTSRQIQRLLGSQSSDPRQEVAESKELEDYVRRNDGEFFAFVTHEEDGADYCHGCLSIMPFEKENLDRFASVIFIDGTQNSSRLGWEMVPITLIDQYRRIRSGGVAFLANTDEQSIHWLLQTLSTLPPVREHTKTLITDEDSAFIPAIEDLREEWPVNHVLCAYHKEQNFAKKLSKCGLSKLEKSLAKDLFKVICYSTHKDAVDKAVEDLKAMHPTLLSYLEKHVVPTIGQFSRAYLSEVWTKGYNTTSPAESHNAMYKAHASGCTVSLKQMRLDYTEAHQEAEKSFNERIHRSFTNTHFTWEIAQMMLSPRIRDLIDELNVSSQKYCCVEHEGKWKLFHPESDGLYHLATPDSCTCGRLTHEGIPCAHILRVISEVQGSDLTEWPFRMVHPDWVISCPAHVLVTFDRDGNISDEQMGEPTEEMAEEDLVCSTDELDADGGHVLVDEDILQISTNLPAYTQRKRRYLRLYHLMKTVVSVASRGVRTSQMLLSEFTRIKSQLMALPEREHELPPAFQEEEDNEEPREAPVPQEEPEPEPEPETRETRDVHDITGTRRGRKKKSVREPYSQSRGSPCFLCGARHMPTNCRRYKEYAAAREHNSTLPDQEGRGRCRVCLGYGHNAKTCSWLAANSSKKRK